MLIKLTQLAHPDLNGGRPQPCYIDASRVLLICQGHFQYPKIGVAERNKELYDSFYNGVNKLADMVNDYIPPMTDPVAVGWMKTIQTASMEVQAAYRLWGSSYNRQDYHPRMECTEVQLACGTALEHGVMLTRVWVTETPEQVEEKIAKATSAQEGRAMRRAV